jgi:hypothetical protein
MRRIDLGADRGLGRLEAGLIIIIQRTHVLPQSIYLVCDVGSEETVTRRR